MKAKCIIIIAAILFPTGGLLAAPGGICPPAIPHDTKVTVRGSLSASIISKLLSSIGLAGEYESEAKARLPTQDDRVGAIQAMAIVCAWLEADTTMTTEKKIEILRGWIISITLSQKTSSMRNDKSRIAKNYWKNTRLADIRIAGSTAALPATELGEVILSPPPPPPRGAVVLKVFPKSNLTLEDILRLRVLLPEFDIRQGVSSLTRYPADVLFVDREKVPETAVINVMTALRKLGVAIKSVQQSPLASQGIQVGTIVPTANRPAFSEAIELDVDKLQSLSGDAFWTAAFNGQAWCNTGIGTTVRCAISADGRPTRVAIPAK